MSIPFRDLEEEPSGVAAYLRFIDEPDEKGIRGALFIMSPRGDPLEFTFTRVDLRSGVLWRDGQARSRAVSSLTRALFESANHVPDLILALAEETPKEVFTQDLAVQVPACRVTTQELGLMEPSEEIQHLSNSVSLLWVNRRPEAGRASAKIVEMLEGRRLLLEPFDRAALGIQEAFES